jgi:hypothetical protein
MTKKRANAHRQPAADAFSFRWRSGEVCRPGCEGGPRPPTASGSARHLFRSRSVYSRRHRACQYAEAPRRSAQPRRRALDKQRPDFAVDAHDFHGGARSVRLGVVRPQDSGWSFDDYDQFRRRVAEVIVELSAPMRARK